MRRGGRYQTVAHAPGGLSRLWTGGGDVDRAGLLRACVEPRALHAQVLAGVARLLAGEELLNDLDGFDHALQAYRRFGPFAAHDVFVERLARADAQPEAVGVHGGQRGGGLRENGRVVAIRGAGDAGSKGHLLGRGAERAHPRPDERTLPLLRNPRVKVIGSHHAAETGLFRLSTPTQQVVWTELL